MYKRTHLALQNIVLNYDFPKKLVKKMNMENFSVCLTGDNLGIWTPYDRSEVNSYRNSISGYPAERAVSCGFNMIF